MASQSKRPQSAVNACLIVFCSSSFICRYLSNSLRNNNLRTETLKLCVWEREEWYITVMLQWRILWKCSDEQLFWNWYWREDLARLPPKARGTSWEVPLPSQELHVVWCVGEQRMAAGMVPVFTSMIEDKLSGSWLYISTVLNYTEICSYLRSLLNKIRYDDGDMIQFAIDECSYRLCSDD